MLVAQVDRLDRSRGRGRRGEDAEGADGTDQGSSQRHGQGMRGSGRHRRLTLPARAERRKPMATHGPLAKPRLDSCRFRGHERPPARERTRFTLSHALVRLLLSASDRYAVI